MSQPRAAAGPGFAGYPTRRDLGFTLGVAVAALAAVITHARSLGAPFFADDWLFLDQVRFRSLFRVLASPDPLGNYFRPLGRQVWFWLLARLGSESATVFHAGNLLCLVAAVVLLGVLTRRVAGAFAGVVAASFLALHYAADVPVLWVSGSQELLSLALGLGALVAYARGRRVPAAALYLAALLSKEVVVLLPVVAIALDRSGTSWRDRARRAWPLGVALLAWGALAAFAMARRGTAGAGLSLTAGGPVAAIVLLVRVALGLEWQTGALPYTRWADPGLAGLLALLAAGVVILAAAPRAAKSPDARARRGSKRATEPRSSPKSSAPAVIADPPAAPPDPAAGLRAGLAWAVAGAFPVSVVAQVWSAYYFLFALAGVGLALGSLVALRRMPAAVAAAIVVGLGLASTQARGLEEFATAPSAWSGQSHVNCFYLERGLRVIPRGLEDLRAALPQAAPRTTFFFAGLPPFSSFQVADGPLVRGAYRDSSLRGYYLSEFTRDRLERGPWAVFFFNRDSGRLVDRTHDPSVFISTALGQMVSDRLDVAEAALEAAAGHGEMEKARHYLSALVVYARGDSTRAQQLFAAIPRGLGRQDRGALALALRQADAGDSATAMRTLYVAMQRSVLDPELHALSADLLLARPETESEGEVEAFAARVLDPGSPAAWRRWASVLAHEGRQELAIAALDRYYALKPEARKADLAAARLRALLVRMLPGGDIVQRSMKRELER